MALKVSVYIATSLDGFIARADGGIDWLSIADAHIPEGEDCGFSEFMASVDTLAMGRKTFEQLLTFDQWAYGDTPLIVLSSNPVEIPEHLRGTVSHSSETPAALCERLEREGAARIYADGGNTIQRFLQAGLVTDFTITTLPILIGQGIPLFGGLERDLPLKHTGTTAFEFGFVQSRYEVLAT